MNNNSDISLFGCRSVTHTHPSIQHLKAYDCPSKEFLSPIHCECSQRPNMVRSAGVEALAGPQREKKIKKRRLQSSYYMFSTRAHCVWMCCHTLMLCFIFCVQFKLTALNTNTIVYFPPLISAFMTIIIHLHQLYCIELEACG